MVRVVEAVRTWPFSSAHHSTMHVSFSIRPGPESAVSRGCRRSLALTSIHVWLCAADAKRPTVYRREETLGYNAADDTVGRLAGRPSSGVAALWSGLGPVQP